MDNFEQELKLLRDGGLKSSPLRKEYKMLRTRKTSAQIIESASRPIKDLDDRLSVEGFQKWYENQ